MNRVRLPARLGLCVSAVLLTAVPGPTADPPKTADPPAAKLAHLDLDELAPHPDLEWLRRAKVPTDDAGLVKFLNGLRGPEADPAEVERLATQLRTGSKAEQAAAAAKLAEVGAVAVPVLRRHRLGPDPAAAARVRTCLAKIEEAADKPLARPAMRRLMRRTAPGAAEALLGYVPFAFDPAAELDAWYGLDELAGKDPKVLAVLAGALADKQPARRAVAACLLGRRGDAARKAAVAGLLKDGDPEVRLRAAQGLLAGRDAAGVPTLIDLLTDAGVEVRWQAEELLRWLAVDTAPDVAVGAGDAKEAEACRAAWRKWWTDRGGKADVAAAEAEPRRPLLLLAYDRKGGRCWVVGCDGVTRHEWKGLDRLTDAQYVPGGGVLTLHEQPVREKPLLAERDMAGKPLWQHDDMRDPKYCQRLGNGHVFVAERQDIVEPYVWFQTVAPGGRQVSIRPEKCSARLLDVSLRRTRDGKVLTAQVSNTNPSGVTFTEYDPSTDTFMPLPIQVQTAGELPWVEEPGAGSYLMSALSPWEPDGGEILELAPDGFTRWSYRLPGSRFAARLRGGNTVVCVSTRVVEITPDKRMTGETVLEAAAEVTRPILGLVRFGLDNPRDGFDLRYDADHRAAILHRGPKRVRLNALVRLIEAGPEAASCIPQLEKFQDDPDPDIRKAARRALDGAGQSRIPTLLADLKHPDASRRQVAVDYLSTYSRDPRVVDACIAALQDEDPKVRHRAAHVLGRGEPDPQLKVPGWARRGHWRSAADKIVPGLTKLISDKDPLVRSAAFYSLGMMGAGAKPAVPLLLESLRSADHDVRAQAVVALGQIGPVTPEVIPALHEMLQDNEHLDLRSTAALSLANRGDPGADSVKRIIETYRSADQVHSDRAADAIRTGVIHALGRMGPTPHGNIPFLINLLKDANAPWRARLRAAEGLVLVGPLAAAALPTLADLGETSNDESLKRTYTRLAKELRHRVAWDQAR